MSFVKTINFNSLGDSRGELVVLEGNQDIPFDVKRVYYIFGTNGDVARGFHAHKALQQIAVCVAGSCNLVINDGVNKETILLDHPTKGVLVDIMQWHEMHNFSDDCVLLVLASDHYDESDYIRSYKNFLELAGSQ
jgi:dTDP-4-dehydrorhamnose 3,5-epimerase-like enzyme